MKRKKLYDILTEASKNKILKSKTGKEALTLLKSSGVEDCIPVKFMKNFKSKMKQVDNSSWKFENKFVDWLEVECEGEKIKFIQIALF